LDVASISTPSKRTARSGVKRATNEHKKAAALTKTSSVTHGARWTPEEDAQLLEGIVSKRS
jgi:hypothetical protein